MHAYMVPSARSRDGHRRKRGTMTIAAKHLDLVVGVDTHIVMVPTPAGPVPTPLPQPFVGIVFDEFDYIPGSRAFWRLLRTRWARMG